MEHQGIRIEFVGQIGKAFYKMNNNLLEISIIGVKCLLSWIPLVVVIFGKIQNVLQECRIHFIIDYVTLVI